MFNKQKEILFDYQKKTPTFFAGFLSYISNMLFIFICFYSFHNINNAPISYFPVFLMANLYFFVINKFLPMLIFKNANENIFYLSDIPLLFIGFFVLISNFIFGNGKVFMYFIGFAFLLKGTLITISFDLKKKSNVVSLAFYFLFFLIFLF